MKLFVGLGNPGEKYKNNRHNVGFMMCDFIASHFVSVANSKWTSAPNNSDAYLFEVRDKQILLLKPQTFMNKSGEAVRKIKEFYKISLEDILVIHDDLDIKLGEYKIQKGKGPKVHNGLISIEQQLGTADFTRIRIGVDNRDSEFRIPGEVYVLSDFKMDEKKILESEFQTIWENLESL